MGLTEKSFLERNREIGVFDVKRGYEAEEEIDRCMDCIYYQRYRQNITSENDDNRFIDSFKAHFDVCCIDRIMN